MATHLLPIFLNFVDAGLFKQLGGVIISHWFRLSQHIMATTMFSLIMHKNGSHSAATMYAAAVLPQIGTLCFVTLTHWCCVNQSAATRKSTNIHTSRARPR